MEYLHLIGLISIQSLPVCSGQLKLATGLEFSGIGFPIRLVVIHRYIRAA